MAEEQPPPTAEQIATVYDVLEQMARDVRTIATIVKLYFAVSVVVGFVFMVSNSNSGY